MKTKIILTLALSLGMTAACATPQTGTTANTNTNTAMNHNAMNHNAMNHANMNHGGMNHDGMNHGAMNHGAMNHDHANMQSSPNAANAPYDLQFLDTMIAHHQGAVDMSQPAVEKAAHRELRALAQSIIRDQEKEIAQMKQWRNMWYANQPPALNMDFTGMRDSMKGMDMNALNNATGEAYDVMFVEQMIPHHIGAVVMAREALTKSTRPEIKQLSNQIIASQEKEINQMREWLKAWKK